MGDVGGGFAGGVQGLFALVGGLQALGESGQRLFGGAAGGGEGFRFLPYAVLQRRSVGEAGKKFGPFRLQAGCFLRGLGLLGLPFLLCGLGGGLLCPGLLAFLDKGVECRLFFLEGGFGGGNVERGVVGDGRVFVRAA